VFILLYIIGIPALFWHILRRQRQQIFCVVIESDVGEYEAFEAQSDDDSPQLYRRFGMTPMLISHGDKVFKSGIKYTVTNYDDETGEAQFNNDPKLTATNAPNDTFTAASTSFGWMVANYERKCCLYDVCPVKRLCRLTTLSLPYQRDFGTGSWLSSYASSYSPVRSSSSTQELTGGLRVLWIHGSALICQRRALIFLIFFNKQPSACRSAGLRTLSLSCFNIQAVS
jgi:hypothetical protein